MCFWPIRDWKSRVSLQNTGIGSWTMGILGGAYSTHPHWYLGQKKTCTGIGNRWISRIFDAYTAQVCSLGFPRWLGMVFDRLQSFRSKVDGFRMRFHWFFIGFPLISIGFPSKSIESPVWGCQQAKSAKFNISTTRAKPTLTEPLEVGNRFPLTEPS